LAVYPKNKNETTLVLKSDAIGRDKYETAKQDLGAAFAETVDSISQGPNPQLVILHLCKRKVANLVKFESFKDQLKKPLSFAIGESIKGPLVQSLEKLPHMIIAGTTGGGKSVFFKQTLLGILKTTPHLQLYLLDLKRGVEMKEFSALPNVRLAKTVEDAATLLEKLRHEMDQRFIFLEKNGHKEIDPKRDKMDKIVIGIDEASELFTKPKASETQASVTNRAREAADGLAKLARAAGIHLIFATQKVTKETIDTRVQENIGGRMCFRMNTLQGSMTILGNKMGFELPDIKGRGIWANGNDFIEVQAPLISQEQIELEIDEIKEEFEQGKKFILGSMIEISDTKFKLNEKFHS